MRESELHTPHLHTPTYTFPTFSKARSAAITHPPPLNLACNALRKVVLHKRINACAPLNLEGLAHCGNRWLSEIQGAAAFMRLFRGQCAGGGRHWSPRPARPMLSPDFARFKGARAFTMWPKARKISSEKAKNAKPDGLLRRITRRSRRRWRANLPAKRMCPRKC